MNTARPHSERPDTRQHIIDCGRQLIAAKGFVGVGLAEILSTAGVPKGSFYHYFVSKEAFGEALLEDYFDHYEDSLFAFSAPPGRSGAQCLLAYFEHWVEAQQGADRAEQCLIVKLAAEVSDLSETMRHSMLAGTQAILRHLTKLVAAGQADGSIGSRDAPDALALFLYQAWLGASLLAKLKRDVNAFADVLQRTRVLLQLS